MYEDDYNVIIATSGMEGLLKLKQEQDIKLVISDMKMPEMNGLEFIQTLKKRQLAFTMYYTIWL